MQNHKNTPTSSMMNVYLAARSIVCRGRNPTFKVKLTALFSFALLLGQLRLQLNLIGSQAAVHLLLLLQLLAQLHHSTAQLSAPEHSREQTGQTKTTAHYNFSLICSQKSSFRHRWKVTGGSVVEIQAGMHETTAQELTHMIYGFLFMTCVFPVPTRQTLC